MLTLRWLLVVSILALSDAYPQERPKAEPMTPEHTTRYEKPGTEKNPFVIKMLPAQGSEEAAARDDEYRKQKANEDWWVTRSTVWLAAVTTGLAIFTFLLWFATRRLVVDAKNTSKWDLRAYLSPADGKLYQISETVLRAEVNLKNSGRTPAHKVRYAITGELRSPDDGRSFVDENLSTRNQPIAPNAHWTVGHEFLNLTADDIKDVYSDKKWVYIWGQAEYLDIFGRMQTLKFRYRNVVKKLALTLKAGKLSSPNGTSIQRMKAMKPHSATIPE